MTQPLEDTWTTRDLPVLRAVARALDETGSTVKVHTLTRLPELQNMDPDTCRRALVALEDEYLLINWSNRHTGPGLGVIGRMTPAARRATGLWPSPESVTDRMLTALDEQIDAAQDPERKSKLVKVRDSLLGAGRDLMVDVVGAVVSKSLTG